MARSTFGISPSLSAGLANPAFLQGMFTAAQQLGAAPSESRRKKLLDEEMQIFNQGIAATRQDVADPSALSMRIRQLTELLPQASREDALRIQKNINTLSNLYDKTKQTADANKISSIISAENALEKLTQESGFEETDEFAGPLSDEQYNRRTARDALEKRIAELKSDPKVALQVENVKFQQEYDALQNNIKLNTARGQAISIDLSRHKIGSAEFNAKAKQYRDAGLGIAVDAEISRQATALETQERINELLQSTSEVTKDEKARLEAMGLPVTKTNRNKMLAKDEQIKLEIAYRDYNPLKGQAVVETINFFLEKLSREDDRWNVFKSDIGDVAQSLSEEDIQKLSEVLQDRTAVEVQTAVMDLLISKNPEAWKNTQEYRAEDEAEAALQKSLQDKKNAAILAELKNLNLEEGSKDYEIQKLILSNEYDKELEKQRGLAALKQVDFKTVN